MLFTSIFSHLCKYKCKYEEIIRLQEQNLGDTLSLRLSIRSNTNRQFVLFIKSLTNTSEGWVSFHMNLFWPCAFSQRDDRK